MQHYNIRSLSQNESRNMSPIEIDRHINPTFKRKVERFSFFSKRLQFLQDSQSSFSSSNVNQSRPNSGSVRSLFSPTELSLPGMANGLLVTVFNLNNSLSCSEMTTDNTVTVVPRSVAISRHDAPTVAIDRDVPTSHTPLPPPEPREAAPSTTRARNG